EPPSEKQRPGQIEEVVDEIELISKRRGREPRGTDRRPEACRGNETQNRQSAHAQPLPGNQADQERGVVVVVVQGIEQTSEQEEKGKQAKGIRGQQPATASPEDKRQHQCD